MALIDVVSLITPNAAGLGSNYLKSTNPGGTPCITYVGAPNANGEFHLVYMKSLNGSPWDWLIAGNDYVRELLTENIWSDPTTAKMNASFTGASIGARRFPRWIDYTYPNVISNPSIVAPSTIAGITASLSGTPTPAPTPVPVPGSWQFTVQRPESDYIIFGPPGTTGPGVYGYPTSRNTDNYVRNTFSGPYPGAAILDSKGAVVIPAGEDWILTYEWSGQLVNGVVVYNGTRERLYHRSILLPSGARANYGRYAWDTSHWSATLSNYGAPTASSMQNSIVPLPTTPVVPVQKVF